MAETLLARDSATASWATQLLVVTAGSETVTDSFYVDKGVYGPKKIRAALSYPTPGTAIRVDLQISQGGVIWHTIKACTNIGGETFEFPAPQGFFRFRAVSFTGAPTASLTLTALGAGEGSDAGGPQFGSVGTPGTVTEGAALQVGSSSIPLRQDTVNTVFVSMNFVNDAVTGSTMGLRVTLDSGGLLQTYSTAIHGQMNCTCATGNVRNPVAVQGDLSFDATCWIQGLGYGVGTYITLPGAAVTTGTFACINAEINAPAGYSGGASPIMAVWRCAIGGDATALVNLNDNLDFMSIQGVTEGTGNMFSAGADVAAAATLRILVNTTAYYILLGAGEST
jgi:hypothetical protein